MTHSRYRSAIAEESKKTGRDGSYKDGTGRGKTASPGHLLTTEGRFAWRLSRVPERVSGERIDVPAAGTRAASLFAGRAFIDRPWNGMNSEKLAGVDLLPAPSMATTVMLFWPAPP
jgi:hypothetical protein